jgi:lipid-binding SYLF domain-containing protein
MPRILLVALVIAVVLLGDSAFARRSPDESMRLSGQVLQEIMAIPARRIPEQLLADAEGLVIIPGVIKIGFVGGIRRGRGVVLVRDDQGAWSVPQFVILTGGSVGWQAGVQATDVVLVFRTRKSVDGLLDGKFTLGAGASVAAGPLGRSAEAATDVQLKAEILSYSRSRGVFAGVAIDGSAIEIDEEAHQAYYGTPTGAMAQQIPESAMELLELVGSLAGPGQHSGAIVSAVPTVQAAPGVHERDDASDLEAKRRSLADASRKLNLILSARWRRYLALPDEVFAEDEPMPLDALQTALARFDQTAGDAKYKALTGRAEFQWTRSALRDYLESLEALSQPPELASPRLELPEPPVERQR